MKERYERPKAEIEEFEVCDITCSSPIPTEPIPDGDLDIF